MTGEVEAVALLPCPFWRHREKFEATRFGTQEQHDGR